MRGSAVTDLSPRRATTQRKLMAAALGVFAERGVLGASVEQICDAAGFTRGAFYSNFTDKDELCVALLARQRDEILGAVEQVVTHFAARERDGDVIKQAVEMFLALQAPDPAWSLVKLELRLYAVHNQNIRPAYKKFLEQTTDRFAELLSRGLELVGYRLLVEPRLAIALMQSVIDEADVDILLTGRDDPTVGQRRLTSLLSLMAAPKQTTAESCALG